jgi:hypothetical protein
MPVNQQNLNNSTPAAPAGCQNVKWQVDTSTPRNDSAYVPATGGVSVKTGSYQIQASDCGKLLIFEGASNATFELPQAIPFSQWGIFIQNNAGNDSPPSTATLTITPLSGSPPAGQDLDGSMASITLQPGQGVYIATDGTNYFTERGMGGSSLSLKTNGTPNTEQGLLNLSSSLPAAPSGYQNAQFQEDSSGDVSCYLPGSGGVSAKTANYLATAADCGKLLSFNSSSAVTLTLPAAIPFAQWNISIENVGAGALTISRNGLNIDGAAANVTLNQNQGVYIATDGTNYFTERGLGGAGTVTSVGLTMPAEFSVSGSPVTGSGTLAVTKANENANLVYAGPSSGGAAQPTFRSLVSADLPGTPAGGGGMWKLSPPSLSSFSWLNQGGASAVSGTNFLSILAPAASGPNFRILHQACPTAPWDLYVLFQGSAYVGAGAAFGIEVDDGTKLVTFNNVFNGGSSSWFTGKYNSATSFNGSVNDDGNNAPWGGPIWVHVNNTSGALAFSYSYDGVAWRALTLSTSGFLSSVANYGICVSADGTNPASVSCLSFASAMTAN